VLRWLPRDTMVRDAEPLLRYLQQALQRPVSLVLLEDYEQAQARLDKGEVEVLRLMPLAYVKLRERVPGLELLATVVSGGARTYQSVIVTRMGSGLQSLRSLRGKVMCWSSPTSTSGYLFPRALLRSQQLDPDRMFGSVTFSGDHLSSLRAVREGSCDGAGVDSTTFLNAQEEGVSPNAFQVIATTDAIPFDAFAASPSLPKQEREALRAALLAAAPGTPAAAGLRGMFLKIDGFVPADDASYDVVRRVEKGERERARRR
jgi:phosphonate transport system substrate-binding protein